MNKELLKGLSEEQLKKVNGCKNGEELLKLAKEEGVELNDEQLQAVAGGCSTPSMTCPQCGARAKHYVDSNTGIHACGCPNCGTFIC